MSAVARVPEATHDQVKLIAAMQGQAPAELYAQAWQEFFERHRDEFAAAFDEAAHAVREGDTHRVAALMGRLNEDRAKHAAERARKAAS